MAIVTINGRKVFFKVYTMTITKTRPGRWQVVYDGGSFEVIGGRESGGAANEWFCHHPRFYGERWVDAGSMVAAIRIGAVY